MILQLKGSRNATEEQQNGDDSVGREYPILVTLLKRGNTKVEKRGRGMAHAAKNGIVPTRKYVHNIFRVSYILDQIKTYHDI